MARGRPRKENSDLNELQAKADKFCPMTLDEIARLMASQSYEVFDPKTGERRTISPKKYTTMGLQKFEQRTLAKLKHILAKYGIKSLHDVEVGNVPSSRIAC